MPRTLLLLFILIASAFKTEDDRWVCENGIISFVSDAPLEKITARTEQLRGLIEPSKKTFAFSVPVTSFEGFNSELQREHFNENYMESNIHPQATFTGKIVEDVDFSKEGSHQVRAKGELNLHGVKKERIIGATIQVKENSFTVTSDFKVLLNDHKIAIPRIVHQKISEEINVKIEARFKKKGAKTQ